MLRSFFVPKMSSTMTRTINQCQMLNEPMEFSSCRAPNYSFAIMRGSGFGPPMMWMCK